MCGIVGFHDKKRTLETGEKLVRKMADTLSHRGPDQYGYWANENQGLYFGHRRLSIIDLSYAGNQPIASNDGRNAFVFNGEIYNHLEIKKELVAEFEINFRGNSDSEVLYHCLVEWGLEKTLLKVRGMFAFCFYSRKQKKLYLARDRIGEKPLYYGSFGNFWGFASELKALTNHPDFQKTLNKAALHSYFKYGYIPAPLSIWEGINKLLPGAYVVYDLANEIASPQIRWWNNVCDGRTTAGSYDVSLETTLHNQLISSVSEQLVADVPVGAFLSGGVDSSLIVALAKLELQTDIHTFSIGFDDKSVDESKYAKQVANKLGVKHSQWIISSGEALNVIPQLPKIYDEPFGDSSSLPSFLVAQFAKKEVSVVLTGDGADELFGGYGRYHNKKIALAWRLWLNLKNKSAAQLLIKSFGEGKLMRMLAAKDFQEFYSIYTSHWMRVPMKWDSDKFERSDVECSGTLLEKMMYQDTNQYLPDCILTKVDRSTMSHGLESRLPFLDSRVLATSSRLNQNMFTNSKKGKLVLRRILENYLPANLINRPKQGFAIPLGQWLVNDLRQVADHYLCESSINRSGVLDCDAIVDAWNRLKKGEGKYQYHVWLVLVFQIWFQEHSK